MSITLAKLLVVVGSDTKEAEKGLGDVNKALKGTESIGSNALGVFSGILMAKAVSGMASLTAQGVTAYASYERLGMSLDALAAREALVSGKAVTMADALEMTKGKGDALLGTIEQMGIKSPFRQETISTIIQTAMGYGMASDMSLELTQSLVDLAAATGRGEKDLNLMGLALGQVWAKGKLTGEEMRQLTNAGISVADVARAMNIPISDVADSIKAGEIAARDLIPALIDVINTDFGGEAERQATSWAGLISTFQDLQEVNLREFFSGTLQELQPLAAELADILGSAEFRAQVRETGQQLGETVGEIVTAGRELLEFWQGIPGPVQTSLLAFGGVMVVGPQIVSTFGGVVAGGVKLVQVFAQLQSGVGFFAVAQQGAVGLAGALLPVAAAAAAVTAAWVEYQRVQQTVNQGNQATAQGWDDYISKMVAGGASAGEVMENILAKQAELNTIMESSGPLASKVAEIMGADVSPSIEQVTIALKASGASYDEYTGLILDYLVAVGQVPEFERDSYAEMLRSGDAMGEVANELGILTPEMYASTVAIAKHSAAVEMTAKDWQDYQKYMLMGATATRTTTTAIAEQNPVILETSDILALVSDLYQELPTNLTDVSDASAILSDASLIAKDATADLRGEVSLATEAYAYGVIGYERYAEVLVNATQGTLTFTDAQRQSITTATLLGESQAASAEAAAGAAKEYWGLAEALKGAGSAEIAKTLISELTTMLDEGKITPEQYGAAVGELGDAFGISDERSRALAAGIPLLAQALANSVVPTENADEALRFLVDDAADGTINFGKLIEKFGAIPASLQPGEKAAESMGDMWSNDVYEAIASAEKERETFATGMQELYEWVKAHPIEVQIIMPTVPTATGTGGGGTGGGGTGGGGIGGPEDQYDDQEGPTGGFTIINNNYDQESAAFAMAYSETMARERLASNANR